MNAHIESQDAQEQLLRESETSFAVLGNGADFILFDLAEPLDEETTEELQRQILARGLSFSGSIGLRDGALVAVSEPDPGSYQPMLHAALEAARRVAARLTPPGKGDEVQWLKRLYALADVRT